MGICYSSESVENQESDENMVYVVEEEGLCSPSGISRLVSLFSRQGKKGTNQDTAILYQGYGMDDGVFCGVFDGHGRNGHVVSKLVRDHLPSLLLSKRNDILQPNKEEEEEEDSDEFDGGDVESSVDFDDCSASSPEMFDEWKEVCINAFKAMDGVIQQNTGLDCSCSGSTAVTIIKQGQDLVIANLGDSRAVLGTTADGGGELLKAVQLTTDLKPSLPKEAERIKRRNGRIFALRDEPNTQRVWMPNLNYPGLAMARAFGDFQLKKYGVIAIPQVSYHRLTAGDQFLILATDGVWDVLSNEQVVSIVSAAGRREEASKAVVEAAVRAWKRKFPSSKRDDCSVICFFLQERVVGATT